MIELFTKQERLFISFLVFGILLGAAIRLYRSYVEPSPKIDPQLTLIEQQIKEKAAEIDSLLEETEQFPRPVEPVQQLVVSPQTSSVKKTSKTRSILTPIDINQATIEELIQIPQIGQVIAARIVEYRKEHGNFKQIEELLAVKGVGRKKLEVMRPYIFVQDK
ncbi:MAG: helix-hairpin-helix domain-containing protein [candidate division KSB1 bacterium]|nr:helix-hairpin-helix domain-containing protein [candidate division KSB1 bacterium]MDZ7335252.1 helix-hairpin-helix domain-containing protein [candidate division KSB1 bacterium]MDZ7357998.1 helix-hairpin-helix domain-containing protein [candidate division KSB1 bacterium]MDZ7376640.1 helix-hairpin-helix domain-containing protein [candidate division KSB1 bacterium]MDZ7399789.1 helix-hairpin-helix domain-containing protein [candidate division KSB1 bacterium]